MDVAMQTRSPQQRTPSATRRRRGMEGIVTRHRAGCATRRDGGACDCEPAYQAQAWSARDKKSIRRTFPTPQQARAWRQETQVALRRNQLRAPTSDTLTQAAAGWLDAAQRGVVRTRSGDAYKPSAIRTYRQSLNAHILPAIGHLRLSAVERRHLQHLIDQLLTTGAAPSTVRNAILPVRAIYRHATNRDHVATNPTHTLTLPSVRARRDRVARPDEAAALIAAVPPDDQALWATALYAGLRRGELQALRWRDIDLQRGVIRVERGWDRVVGAIEPKSRSGQRRVPLTHTLRRHLTTHRLRHGGHPETLVFANNGPGAFNPAAALKRARRAWREAQLAPILFHECRHTYASFMIAAGINAKALSTYMGHASITITLDRYGHLLPGNEHQAATMLDTYLGYRRDGIPAAQSGRRRP
jgi:integrase